MNYIDSIYSWYSSLSDSWQTTLFSVILVPIVLWLLRIIFSKKSLSINKSTIDHTVFDLYEYLRKHDVRLSLLRDWTVILTFIAIYFEMKKYDSIWISLIIIVPLWLFLSRKYLSFHISTFDKMMSNTKTKKKHLIKLSHLINDNSWNFPVIGEKCLLIVNIKYDMKF